jgi:hypothetical protein
MSDPSDPQRPPRLSALRRDPLADQVERVELDESLEKYQRDPPRAKPIGWASRSRWITLAVVGIAAVFAYIRFFHAEKPTISSDAVATGWDDLRECSTTTSVDGQRWLALSSDQTAELTDRSEQASKNNARNLGLGNGRTMSSLRNIWSRWTAKLPGIQFGCWRGCQPASW